MGRILPRIELEQKLDQLRSHPEPNAEFEQYTTPTKIAAEILFTAAHVHNDIADKTIVDLGCGSGKLGIGAILLGAHSLVGVDIDPKAIEVAHGNAEAVGVFDRCNWVAGDISLLRGVFDTILMNPPFGTRQKHLDARFLTEAMKHGRVIYTLHKSSTRKFVTGFITRRRGSVSAIVQTRLDIPRMFDFHRKKRKQVLVDLYRVERKDHRVY